MSTCWNADSESDQMEPHRVQIDDIEMYVETAGRGEPVLLLHGGAVSGTTWRGQIPALAPEFRLVIPDSRGHGATSDGPGPLSYARMALDFVALLDSLGIGSAHIVGWSDGGVVGLELAVRHSQRVRSLVVLGANYHHQGLSPEFQRQMRAFTPDTWNADVIEEYRRKAPDPDHWAELFSKLMAMWSTQPAFGREELRTIAAPTLVVMGETEETIRHQHFRELADAIPGARLEIIAGTGHFAHLQRPAEVNALLLRFLHGGG